ncbi:MAG: sigma-54-dependent transcriptional regulator [bacterium]
MSENKKKFHILVVEDNDTMREGMARVVHKLGHRAAEAVDGEQAMAMLRNHRCRLVITDYKLPGMDGLTLLQKIKQASPETEALVITAYGTIELAVAAMQKGAADFITKPFSPEELTLKINQILARIQQNEELRRLAEENRYLREQVEGQFNFGEIIGKAPAMQDIYRTIEKVARGDSSVIIYGESGTGKELIARAIHKASPRRERAFVRVNCGALAVGVLESELFGHERGAFTGALKRKKGRFELAEKGSLFLDEIGDIPLSTQVKLLRVLQEKEFERVGGEETLTADVRIIAATNKNLQQEIAQGHFREDLYYRLHIIPLHLPPLRERKEDIPLLVGHFMKKIAAEVKMAELSIDDAAIAKLLAYHWPGNIRELENVLERAAVLCEDQRIRAHDLPLFSEAAQLSGTADNELNLNKTLESVERELLKKALTQCHGIKTAAAKRLGIKTSALYYKLEKYGLI